MNLDDETARLLAAAGIEPAEVVYIRREPPPTVDTAELDQLVNEWTDHRAAREKIERQLADVEALILARLKPGQRHEIAPGVGVTIRAASRRFDPELARELLTADELRTCTVAKFDAAIAKKILEARHQADQAMAPGAGKPSVIAL